MSASNTTREGGREGNIFVGNKRTRNKTKHAVVHTLHQSQHTTNVAPASPQTGKQRSHKSYRTQEQTRGESVVTCVATRQAGRLDYGYTNPAHTYIHTAPRWSCTPRWGRRGTWSKCWPSPDGGTLSNARNGQRHRRYRNPTKGYLITADLLSWTEFETPSNRGGGDGNTRQR